MIQSDTPSNRRIQKRDEIQVACRTQSIAEDVVKTAQEAMRATEEYFKFRVQLDTEGKIGKNWADCH